MSWQHVTAALAMKPIGTARKAVLVAICSHVGAETDLAWPSNALIAQETELTRQSVSLAIQGLKADGYLEAVGLKRQVVQYRVPLALLAANERVILADVSGKPTPTCRANRQAPVGQTDTTCRANRHGTVSEQSVEQSVEQSLTADADAPDADLFGTPIPKARKTKAKAAKNEAGDLARSIVKAWADGLDVKPIGKGWWFPTVATVQAALVGHSQADVIQALQTCGAPVSNARMEIALKGPRVKTDREWGISTKAELDANGGW